MNKGVLFGMGILCGALGFAPIIDSATATPQTIKNYDPSISLAPLVNQLSPVVVNIEVSSGRNGVLTPLGQGSGFIISEDGYILTNHHVVKDGQSVKVHLSNEKTYKGKVVGIDDSLDVALIKIQAQDLPYAKLGNSERTQVGDWVVAIGNPFGFSHSVTAGIISAKGRALGSGPYDDYLQTDASINPGNSGGPLFNLNGEVVGINTAIDARAQGIGFSVPINSVKNVLADLKTKGRASRGWLGISVATQGNNVIVGDVYPNTPAQQYGLRKGDIIKKIDGNSITSGEQLIRTIGRYRANAKITLLISRNGQSKKINLVLGKRPLEEDLNTGNFSDSADDKMNDLGIQVSAISGFDSQNRNKRGLVVLQVKKSSVVAHKLRAGDVIISANNVRTRQASDLKGVLEDQPNRLELKVLRSGAIKTITINLQ